MKLAELCTKCSKPFLIKSEVKMGALTFLIGECGHMEVKTKASEILVNDKTISVDDEIVRYIDEGNGQPQGRDLSSFRSIDLEHTAYPFQVEGVDFAEQTNLCCLIADEMGLGKTIQGLVAIKRNKEKVFPVLFCLKSSTILQWAKEYQKWVNPSPFSVMPIVNRDCIMPGFDSYLISHDFLSRKNVLAKLLKLGIKCIVVDECQAFKDQSSERTKALIKLIQEQNIVHRIFLSGTPIKNRANEYFTILNLLAPTYFHSYAAFVKNWLIPNDKGIYTRIDPDLLPQFKELTSRWIIRREQHDVQKNLPPLSMSKTYVEITDPLIKKAYNAELDLFSNFMLKQNEKVNSTQLLGWLAKLRGFTGQAKCEWANEYANEFLDNTDRSLAIGIHHHSVRDTLHYVMESNDRKPLKLSGEDDIYKKDRICQAFNRGDNRVLIINAIAGGVGLNLQSCSDFVLLERQWSFADEQQFFKRFHRDGQKNPVHGVYAIASGTIDEWFDELVTTKMKICKETYGDNYSFDEDVASDEGFLRELANKTIENKLK